MNFAEIGLIEPVMRAVTAAGYVNPTPVQEQSIPHIIAGRDLLGCAQTGTGKTAAFALPILHRLTVAGNPPRGRGRPIRVLVLSPTRELASQIATSFAEYGAHTTLRQTTVFGGVSQHRQVRDLEHGVDVLVATPGRLLDLMEQGFVDLSRVQTLVIDEADRMFDMGFLPDVRRIIGSLPRERQTVMFSATMVPAIEQLANSVLNNPVQIRIAAARETTELIEQSVHFVPHRVKGQLLAHYLATADVTRAVVFTRTKHGADRVVRRLEQAGIDSVAIHGNKSQNARDRALAGFRNSHVRVLVATDVAARGLDVEGISHVFNFDLPEDPKTYVHRIGRTGRAGASGVAIAFCDAEERRLLREIERGTNTTIRIERDLPADFVAVDEPSARSERPLAERRPVFQPRGANASQRSGERTDRPHTAVPAPHHRPADGPVDRVGTDRAGTDRVGADRSGNRPMGRPAGRAAGRPAGRAAGQSREGFAPRSEYAPRGEKRSHSSAGPMNSTARPAKKRNFRSGGPMKGKSKGSR